MRIDLTLKQFPGSGPFSVRSRVEFVKTVIHKGLEWHV